jgi:hypothetical protein
MSRDPLCTSNPKTCPAKTESNCPCEHDPLCPFARLDYWLNEPPVYCICRWIPAVREAERERAKAIVNRFDMCSSDRNEMHASIDGVALGWYLEESL